MQPYLTNISCLAISGSLRQDSSNTRLLEAAAECAPPEVTVEIYTKLGDLPHFNPDHDPRHFESVEVLTRKVRCAHGIIVSTPEYAHGLPGALKNAFDWLVGSDAFVNKPFIMLLNASARSVYAQQSLVEILKTMSGIEIELASTTIPLLGRNYDRAAILAQADFSKRIHEALSIFVKAIRAHNQQFV